MTPTPSVTIVGSGALGGYLGARLAHAGLDVHFLVRSDFEPLRRKGFTIELADEDPIIIRTPIVSRSSASIGPGDLVLIALKTTQNAHLGELLPPLVRPETVIFTVQNGLGNVEHLAALFPHNAIAAGLCQIGVTRVAPGHIVNFTPGGGFIQIGAPDDVPKTCVRALSTVLERAQIKTRQTERLGEALWRKLMWNVPYNGLTIISGGLNTGEIVESPLLNQRTEYLMEELRAAAGALGFPIEASYTPRLIEFTRRLRAYRPSTLIDYENGRPIEIEAIWGEPLRRGLAAGVPMPALQELYDELRRADAHHRRP